MIRTRSRGFQGRKTSSRRVTGATRRGERLPVSSLMMDSAETAIDVKRLVGSDFALSADSGDRVFAAIDDALREGRLVVLDFAGLDNATTVFLNAAVGRLYGSYDADRLREQVRVANANELVARMFRLVTKNAKRYFEDQRRAEERDELLLEGA